MVPLIESVYPKKIESDIKELIDFEDLDSLADRIIDYFIKLLSGA